MEPGRAALTGRLPQLAKYEVLEEIGHGGMATVYRARDRRLGREVAVKVIHPHLRDSREVVSRFATEAKAVAKLRHRNIVEIFDVSEADEPEQYLVAELLGGTTLRKLLQQHRTMPPEIAAAIALELLGALAHANAAGVVHRDIKPENVLIEHRTAVSSPSTPAPTGDRVVVKLTDFGIAKLLDAQGVTSTGQVLGSPAHMAPEQIEGGEVDGRADVFGLGVLLYECMVGHLPFEGTNPAQVLRRVLDGQYPEAQGERALVGSRWSALLDRALAHAQEDRFADASTMRAALVEELLRLDIPSPENELEAWLDDPEGYEARHTTRMIEKLCALASEARKRGDVLSAASDYNRALAHAPDDPQLLRIVAGMNRAEARGRMARRSAGVLAVMIGLGALAFGIGRAYRARIAAEWIPAPSVTVVAPPPTQSAAQAIALPSATTSASSDRRAVLPGVGHEVAAKDRTIRLDLQPPMGVLVSIDGLPFHDVNTGETLTLDAKPHALTFSCSVCTQVRLPLAAGDKDETLKVSVPIKPATLIIDGDPDKTYQIVEHPEISVRVGTNPLTLRSAFERVRIQQIETKTTVPVTLEAGKADYATFR